MIIFRTTVLGLALALAGCATTTGIGSSPEAQIKTGADTVRASALTAQTLLREHKISLAQAKGYTTMLHAAGSALNDANADLVQCRATTAPAPAGAADPCWPKVSDVVGIALDSIARMARALDSK